ncbi:alpha/beta fold hydrolase [Spongisporangium articulatum]|uniref:Alpha/beta fold hydrolase n=1 Tax=Spongisporangium articulatum TaxID=3362603 RepID=A0ABW8AK83_9ACTN
MSSEHTLAVPGATLSYEENGSGPVVVQAHGMLSSRAAELDLGLDFSPLAATHTLVRYDARGHGASTGRPEPDDYRWSNLATDLLALVDTVDGPVDAIGASMGTATILTAAVRRPEAFRRLVLVIPPTAWEGRAAQRDAYEAGADVVEQQGLAAFAEGMQGLELPPVVAELGATPAVEVPETLLPSLMRGAARSNLPDLQTLAGLQHPVLLLPWIDDPVHPLSTAEKLAATLPDARLHMATSAADVRAWPQLVADFLR